jgi:hypothetical protein
MNRTSGIKRAGLGLQFSAAYLRCSRCYHVVAMRSVESPPNFKALGSVVTAVATIAFVWGVQYTSNGANAAFAALPGNQDPTYQVAQVCKLAGGPLLLIGLLTLLIGFARNR